MSLVEFEGMELVTMDVLLSSYVFRALRRLYFMLFGFCIIFREIIHQWIVRSFIEYSRFIVVVDDQTTSLVSSSMSTVRIVYHIGRMHPCQLLALVLRIYTSLM